MVSTVGAHHAHTFLLSLLKMFLMLERNRDWVVSECSSLKCCSSCGTSLKAVIHKGQMNPSHSAMGRTGRKEGRGRYGYTDVSDNDVFTWT